MILFKKIISIILCVSLVALLCACNKDTHIPDEPDNKIPVITEEIEMSQIADFESKETEDSQVGLIVDSWLKIISIGESEGILTVLVRNVADFDVQYAVLEVADGYNTAKFSITTLTAGATMVLKCENSVRFNENARYYGWEISEKAIFSETLLRHTDTFEIDGEDGEISIKNISNKNIKGDIYVYYKTVIDGVYVEGTTYRVRVDGLKKGEQTRVLSQHYKKETSRIMFVTYEK
ncbi:MAG: hypothetical protein IKV25_01000 [Clostridia bacterium]|nr:hypothetical protein [Clostridia bacterium]